MIDYLLHICATFKIPVETPISCIEELAGRDIITLGEAEELKRLVRFRNLVVHEYGS